MVTKGIFNLFHAVIKTNAVVFITVLLYQKPTLFTVLFFDLIANGACFFGVFVILLLRVLFESTQSQPKGAKSQPKVNPKMANVFRVNYLHHGCCKIWVFIK
jgi:hypothetical protein